MRAARFSRFDGPEVLEIVDLPDPHPGAGEIRIRVRAAGVDASDWKKRQGLLDQELPQTLGYEAAGVVDEIGTGVDGVAPTRRPTGCSGTGRSTEAGARAAVGDRVFGMTPYGAAQAELTVLSDWTTLPDTLDDATAAAIPAAAETAARSLDQLGATAGSTVLVNGASGGVGTAAVQLAVHRGARVIGSGSVGTHDLLRSLGAEPVAYGPGMSERVRALCPDGVDLALDVAGSGVLPELVALTGAPDRVITVADVQGAQETGVRFSRGDTGRATYALGLVAGLAATGQFVATVGHTFALADVADAHRVGEAGTVRDKLVLLVDGIP